MVTEKGLSEEAADKIGEYVRLNGSSDLIQQLKEGALGSNKNAADGLKAMELLFQYGDNYGINQVISFDLSLARGLDYYTGLIYEAVLQDKDIECGSIAGGGRYDGLVSMLSDHKNWNVPCVGVSIGIERILSIIEAKEANVITHPTQVLVASIGKGLTDKRMRMLNTLWNAGINAEHLYKNNAKLLSQYQYCEERNIPYLVCFGEDEDKKGIVKLRNIKTREEVGSAVLFCFLTFTNSPNSNCLDQRRAGQLGGGASQSLVAALTLRIATASSVATMKMSLSLSTYACPRSVFVLVQSNLKFAFCSKVYIYTLRKSNKAVNEWNRY